MAKLLGTERNGAAVDKWWLHTDDFGNDVITVETVEDVEPVFEKVRAIRDRPKGKDFRHVASIPVTVIDEMCRIHAAIWGISRREVFAELMLGKTDRAQSMLRVLTHGRDYRKFQSAG